MSSAQRKATINSAAYRARDPAERAHYRKLRLAAEAFVRKHPDAYALRYVWMVELNTTRPADRFAHPAFKDWLRSKGTAT